MSIKVTHHCDHCQSPIPTSLSSEDPPLADVTSSAVQLAVRNGNVVVADLHICQSCIPHLASFLPGVDRSRFAQLATYDDEIGMRSKERVLPGHTVKMTANLVAEFEVNRVILPERSEEWAINDIVVGFRSQFAQGGDVPGDMFKENVDGMHLSFDACSPKRPLTIIATYIGKNPEGAIFMAIAHGRARGFMEDASAPHRSVVIEKHTENPTHPTKGVKVAGRHSDM